MRLIQPPNADALREDSEEGREWVRERTQHALQALQHVRHVATRQTEGKEHLQTVRRKLTLVIPANRSVMNIHQRRTARVLGHLLDEGLHLLQYVCTKEGRLIRAPRGKGERSHGLQGGSEECTNKQEVRESACVLCVMEDGRSEMRSHGKGCGGSGGKDLEVPSNGGISEAHTCLLHHSTQQKAQLMKQLP